jgi:hypothetical protein
MYSGCYPANGVQCGETDWKPRKRGPHVFGVDGRAVESDIAFIKESMELGSAPTAKEKNSTDASVASSFRACGQLDLDDLEDAL